MLLNHAKADWLSTKTIFYNTRTKKISENMMEVVDWESFDFDPEGLSYYLKYGYSVYGKTVVKDVFFLLPNQEIFTENGHLIISDTASNPICDKETTVTETIDLFESKVQNYISNKSDIILPLSGGYDSRWLAYIGRNNNNISTYTYGLSKIQANSSEYIRAVQIAEKCNLKNQLVELSDYHEYCDEWYSLFGPSVHLHGMYQIEFYRKILNDFNPYAHYCISGIYGDAFTGNVRMPYKITRPDELNKLGLMHDMNIAEDIVKLRCPNYEYEEAFWEKHKSDLESENGRILLMVQLKMILLSYLLKVPENIGLSVYAPYLDYDIAVSILSLPWNEKNDRLWQKRYFESKGLLVDEKKKYDPYNSLNIFAYRNRKLLPLEQRLLREVVDEDFVARTNDKLCQKVITPIASYKGSLKSQINKVIGRYNASFVDAYNHYLVLKPLEILIKERDKAINQGRNS